MTAIFVSGEQMLGAGRHLMCPSMRSDIAVGRVAGAHAADVAEAVYRRTDEVSILLARAITLEVPVYGATAGVSFEVVTEGCAANVRAIFGAIAAGGDFHVALATRTGGGRA